MINGLTLCDACKKLSHIFVQCISCAFNVQSDTCDECEKAGKNMSATNNAIAVIKNSDGKSKYEILGAVKQLIGYSTANLLAGLPYSESDLSTDIKEFGSLLK